MDILNKKNQIMDIAEDLFCKYGSKETTVRLITQKAGINTAMLNYYFKSKDNLFWMVMERRIQKFKSIKKNKKPKGRNFMEQFLCYTELYIELIADNLPFYRLMMTEKLLNENKITINKINRFFNANIKTLRCIIENGREENKISPKDIETILMNVSGVLVYAILKSDADSFPLNDLNKIKLQGHIESLLQSFISHK